jgi:hypothetical protein
MHHVAEKIVFMLLGGFIAALGGVIVALWSDSLVRKRERQEGIANRKRDFIEYMVQWKAKFEGWSYVGGGRGTYYQDTVDIFLGKASRIERDLTGARYTAFKAARDKLATLTPHDVEEASDNKGKKLILKAIQDVIDAA